MYGYRNGFVHAIGALAGVVIGLVGVFLLLPIVGGWVPGSNWRIVVVLGVAIALLAGGYAIGTAIAGAIERSVKAKGLRVVNRLLGAVTNVVASALVVLVLSSSLGGFGIPTLSKVIGESTVLRTIAGLTPDPAEAFLAQLRSSLLSTGIPAIQEALGGITETPVLPDDVDTGSEALTRAAQSVVRITGTAASCSQTQSGSGFVVAAERIVTNAHVVSGVVEPIVESPGGQVLTGSVVYFDPVDDLAIIAVPGLDAAPLALGDTAPVGETGVIDGYPFGGPFVTSAAEVLAVSTSNVNDIYGSNASPREVYSLATTVNEGDSGGPFLANDGTVIGVVFAKSANTANLGYAMTMAELDPVASMAPGLTRPVGTGQCVRG